MTIKKPKPKALKKKTNKKDDLEAFLEFGYDSNNKIIMLEDKGNGLSIRYTSDFIKKLNYLDNLNNKPIIIIINHTGGSEVNGLAIYDAIKMCKNKIIGKVYGSCLSMASIILQACTERVLAPHSTVMFHFGSNGYPMQHKQSNYSWVEYEKNNLDVWCDNILYDKIKEKKNITREQFDIMNKNETIWSAQDAINNGLADRLLDPKTDKIF